MVLKEKHHSLEIEDKEGLQVNENWKGLGRGVEESLTEIMAAAAQFVLKTWSLR